jgi:hypothetical protein
MWRESHPKNAKASGIGAIWAVVAGALFYIAYAVFLGMAIAGIFGF